MTGRTDMLHGCVPSWRPDAQADRNYVPETALKQHLEGRHIPYGRLGEHGDALTIDDSTLGAARACRVVGHGRAHRTSFGRTSRPKTSIHSRWLRPTLCR